MTEQKNNSEIFSLDLSAISDRVLDVLIADIDAQDFLARDVRADLRREQRRRRLVGCDQPAGEPVRMILRSRDSAECLSAVQELMAKMDGLKTAAEKHRDAARDLASAAAFYEQIFEVFKKHGMTLLAGRLPHE
jgi:hypothetical protein